MRKLYDEEEPESLARYWRDRRNDLLIAIAIWSGLVLSGITFVVCLVLTTTQ